MAAEIPTVSFTDSLFYNLAHVIPYYTQGIFTRNKFWVSFWDRIHPDPLAVRFGYYLREKYKSPYLFIYMLANKSLLVLDHDGIKRVLDHSPELYADAKLKRDGMSHFQPNAVTISRGEEWRNRRRFNEAVLNYGQGVHQYSDHFLDIIQREVTTKRLAVGDLLQWADFEDLFEKITLQIIFGSGAREDRALTCELHAMMRESNRAFALRKSRHFDPFYRKLRGYLAAPENSSLVSLCSRAPADATTRVENQIPHWMFAMNETLATNTARALALIVAHPKAEERVRAEMSEADLSSPKGIHSLKYLEGCVQEAMRLWPTTPTLARETVYQTAVRGTSVPPGTQVLILNNFNHRDRQTHPFADTFSPELWLNGEVNYYFNHLSNGPQVCAGKELVFFIAKAVLATLLSNDRYVLQKPALDAKKPIPYTYNYFRIVFSRRPLTEEAMSTKKNKAVIQRWVDEGLNRANLALAHDTFAPDAPLHISGAPEGLRGPEGFIQFATGFAAGLPDIHFTIDDQTADGDIVVSRFHVTGTHTGTLMGIPPTGKRVQFVGIVYDRITNGKIAERWEVTDFFGLLQQLGAIPAPGQAQQ